jgi:protein-tyrosine phosphatase
MSKKTILFLCTGNYYRSRYAEALFNHLAAAEGLPFVASSRGLKIDFQNPLPGPASVHTIEATKRLGVRFDERMPQSLTYGDLRSAHLVVAVKEAEHRAMIDANFPGWSQRVVFWNVHDLDGATPDVALAELNVLVRKLIDQLRHVETK